MATSSHGHTVRCAIRIAAVRAVVPMSDPVSPASPRGDDLFVIDDVPWFVRDLAVGDVVRAVAPDPESHPVFPRDPRPL
jgi:hypothetical protein